MERLAEGFTVVDAEAQLLLVLESDTLPVTQAVLVFVPVVVGVTTIVMLAVAELVRLPRLQVTVPPASMQLP